MTVRSLLESADIRAVEALFVDLWGTDASHPPVSADLMQALARFGGYVAGAYQRAGATHPAGATDPAGATELVGASVGFVGVGRPAHLHSHITGVAAAVQGRGAGYAIKRHQRAWALEQGLSMINWTFDPLVRRNGFFNLTRLGAIGTTYIVDCYGEMTDAVNAGQGSDRLVAEWSLNATPPAAEPDVQRLVADGRMLLDIDPAGAPNPAQPGGAGPLLCRVPADIEALRVADPELARRWRAAVRGSLGGALRRGYRVAGATRSGWYLLETP